MTSPTTRTPLAVTAGGLAAGAAGTAAMTAAQTAYMKAAGGEPSDLPAEVGKRIIRGVFHRDIAEERTDQLNNAMHWLYGISWGAIYAITAASRRPRALRSGLLFGLGVWGASLVHLPAMKLSPPVWEQPPKSIASDLGFHLIYGAATAVVFTAIER